MYAWIPAMLPGSGPATSGTISAALVNRIIRGAVNLGASRPMLISVLGFNEARLRNPINRMAWPLVERLFAELEKQFNDPAAVLRLGDVVIAQSFSDIGYLTRLAPHLSDVIEANCQVQAIRQNIVAVEFDPNPAKPFLRWKLMDTEYNIDRFVEFSIATYIRLGVHILGKPMLIKEVHFAHAPRFAVREYENVFKCPIRFNMPQSAAWLDGEQLSLPCPFDDPKMLAATMGHYKIGAKMVESGCSTAAEGFFYLSSELDKSPPTLALMAASLGISERTLRRRLHNEGYPFRKLLNTVRYSLWNLYHMENRYTLGETAHKLGFGELSAFSRAHRQWFGHPPSAYHE